LDSLILAGAIELLGDDPPAISALPQCPGAAFSLDRDGWDLGAPQPVTDIVESLVTDGERPYGTRASNRTLVLPVSVTAPTRQLLAAAKEVLLQLTDQQEWQLQYTRDGSAMPVILDCFRAEPAKPAYDLIGEAQYHCSVELTFQALPYIRDSQPQYLSFASPYAGTTAPGSPVTIDSFAAVSRAQWLRVNPSPAPPGGTHAAIWSSGALGYADYAASLGSPADITGLSALTFWAAFNSGSPRLSLNLNVTFSATLTDAAGQKIVIGGQQKVISTVEGAARYTWNQVSLPIPQQASGFDYAHVVSYELVMTSQPKRLGYPQALINGLHAQAVSGLLISGTRAAVYQVTGLAGAAHAPVSAQFSQPEASIPLSQMITAPGSGMYGPVAAGVTTLDVKATAAGGGGGYGTTSGGGGGAGAEEAEEPSYPTSPGALIPYVVGSGGAGGNSSLGGTPAQAGGNTTFDTTGVVAHGGGPGGSPGTAGTAGTGSASTTHHNGGAGGAGGTGGGGGGGSSAGTSAAGNAGAAGGSFSGGAGGSAPSGGGAGGAGGTSSNTAGSAGSSPGAGGGGGGSGGFGGGAAANGKLVVSWTETQPPFSTLLAHISGQFASPSLNPYVDVGDGSDIPDGTTAYPVQSLASGVNAQFNSTYTVLAVVEAWDEPGSERTVTVTVRQHEYPGGPVSSAMVQRTLTPADGSVGPDLVNGMTDLGTITLPVADIAPDNTQAYYDITVQSTDDDDRFLDMLFLDTQGQTCWISLDGGSYIAYYLDEPDTLRGLGRVLATSYDRASAVSVMAAAVLTGGPLTLDPAGSTVLAYAVEGAPALAMSYYPRWYLAGTA
jgi:hypothetical protein